MSATLPLSPQHPWLAPLAGYSDLPFRLLCREYGATACCTEMVSARGLFHNSPGTVELLRTHAADTPLVVQLFGSEAAVMRAVMPPLLERGFTWFDLNMGCSVPKVTRTASGAALLKPEHLANGLKVARAMLDVAGRGRVGFKLRLGWEAGQESWRELALRLQDAGAGWLTLHPRFARQGFGGQADWHKIGELVKLLDIPVIASGDLTSAAAGCACLAQTAASGVMYARGAMHNPAIFGEHTLLLAGGGAPPPTAGALLALVRRHMELARAHSPERTALLKMRTFVPRYVHHLPGARALRQSLTNCQDWPTLEHVLEDALGAHSQGGEACR